MNPSTAEILRRLGLQQSRVFALEEASNLPADEELYLRYATTAGIANHRTNSEEIRQLLPELQEQYVQGQLVGCEKWYTTIIGGATLIQEGFAYSEIVAGHSSALLRRGCCGVRSLRSSRGVVQTTRMTQKWRVHDRLIGTYVPFGLIDRDAVAETEEYLRPLCQLAEPGLLLEWMWTTEGFFYCDAQRLVDESFGHALPLLWQDPPNPVPLRVAKAGYDLPHSGRVIVDAFDCEVQSHAVAGDIIVCINSGLLSHYVIRAIPSAVDVLWINPSNLTF